MALHLQDIIPRYQSRVFRHRSSYDVWPNRPFYRSRLDDVSRFRLFIPGHLLYTSLEPDHPRVDLKPKNIFHHCITHN